MSALINSVQVDRFRKSQKNIIVLDATWCLAEEGRNPEQEFENERIAGARFLNLEDFNDKTSTLPNMLTREEERIAALVGALGITNEYKIVFYDNSNLHSSCRALWMFKVFGHNPSQLYILDGGLAAWKKYGGKVESGALKPAIARKYEVCYVGHFVRTLMQMKSNLHHPAEQVVDMRPPVRYAGGPEHRPGVRSGHIPGSVSFPYLTMFESTGLFKPIEKIRKQLTGIGVQLEYPIVTLCGSGITAAILDFALDLLDHQQHSVYDGSWSEWGAEKLYAGETSLDERPVKTSLENNF